jgi:hypothetical protein
MAQAHRRQSRFRSWLPTLGVWPASMLAPEGRIDMNWLWITVPLGAAFFIAMTAIPLWLTFRRLDTAPAIAPVPSWQ